MLTLYTVPERNKLLKVLKAIVVLTLLSFPLYTKAQSCNVHAINFLDQEYDSPCEGGGVTLTAYLFSGTNGTINWYRNGGAMPSTAYTYQNQLYIIPYYNADQGIYMAVYSDNNTGCKDTGWIQLNTLTPAVVPQIQWVQDLCGEVQVKAINVNDPVSANNTYVWMDQDGYFSIYSQYLNTNQSAETVQITNSDGCSATTTAHIQPSQMNGPAKPSAIAGTTSGLCGLTNRIYSVTNTSGITYNWSVPAGANITSGQGTYRIHVNFPSSNFSGYISVTASDNCGTSASRSLTVKGAPPAPTVINGPATVCSGTSGNAYSITVIASATDYTWTVPSGSHITANGITSSNNILTTTATSVTVQFGAISSSSVIKVRANNNCGSGSTRSKTLIPCSPRLGDNNQYASITAYPNPVKESVMIKFNSESAQSTKYIIYDMSGRVALDNNFTAAPGTNELSLNLQSLREGIYLFQLVFGEEKQQVRIVKE